MGQAMQPQQSIKINLAECPDIKCTKCEGIYFITAIRIKKISILISPTGKEEMQPIQTFICMACNEELVMV
jgi:hypothetical protein